MNFLRTPHQPRNEPDLQPSEDATLRSWFEEMGFAVPADDFRVPDDDDERPEPAAPVLDGEPYPQSDGRAASSRFKLPVLALGAVVLVPVGGVLLAAAYLSGFDRPPPLKSVVVEAVVPTVAAQAPGPSPAPLSAAPGLAATLPPSKKTPSAKQPVGPPQLAPAVVLALPASPAVGTAEAPGGPASRASVVIYVPDDDVGSASRLDAVVTRLTSNVGQLETRPVTVGPNAREIRFFHPGDSAAAHAVANMLSRLRGSWRVRDVSSLRPAPPEGTLEVWLPSSRAAPVYAAPLGG